MKSEILYRIGMHTYSPTSAGAVLFDTLQAQLDGLAPDDARLKPLPIGEAIEECYRAQLIAARVGLQARFTLIPL